MKEDPEKAIRGSGKRCAWLQKGVCEEVWETWSRHAFVIWLPSHVSPVLAYLSLLSLHGRVPETLARKSRKVNGPRPVPLAGWEKHFVLTAQEAWGFLVGVSAVLRWVAKPPESQQGARSLMYSKTVTVSCWGNKQGHDCQNQSALPGHPVSTQDTSGRRTENGCFFSSPFPLAPEALSFLKYVN